MKKLIAIVLIALAASMLIGLWYFNNTSANAQVFSPYSLLASSWEKYKQTFINQDGRIIDYSQNEMTTSEGQSYAMLRAVWSDDRPTFDLVWNWTKNNLKRNDDSLFGWNWGKREDGSYGLLPNGGDNSATDADLDIALALIFASSKWGDQSYLAAAQPIITDIWNKQTVEVNGKRYMIAGDWANSDTEIIMNPSYFAPYTWRIFSEVDTEHDWKSLVTPAYEVLTESGKITLEDKAGVGLPPNWIAMDKTTGALRAPSQIQLSTRYSYDAMRVPWRIAVDYRWFGDEQALTYLKSLSALSTAYQQKYQLTSTYEHDGTPVTDYESPAMYATALGYFMVVEPELAKKIYDEKIIVLYSSDTYTFKTPLNYYDQNWLWFSLALYYDQLPNLHVERGSS